MPETTRTAYYQVRQATPAYDGYWGLRTDPDGKVRNRLAERVQWANDNAHIVRWLDDLAPGRLLDVGCGPGWLLSESSGLWVKYGVDVCEQAVAASRGLGLDVFCGELWDAAYTSGSFDVVVMNHVIEHVPEPERLMEEVYRVLVPGGRLLVGTPDFDCPTAKRFGERYRMLHDPTHIRLFSCESLHRFLRDYGFRVDDLAYPFPARYATADNFKRWLDPTKVSPPWPGNWLELYCTKI